MTTLQQFQQSLLPLMTALVSGLVLYIVTDMKADIREIRNALGLGVRSKGGNWRKI